MRDRRGFMTGQDQQTARQPCPKSFQPQNIACRLSIIIPCLNAGSTLSGCLEAVKADWAALQEQAALVPQAQGGLVPEARGGLVPEAQGGQEGDKPLRVPDLALYVVDGGSEDDTQAVALQHGVPFIQSQRGRGTQLRQGAIVAQASLENQNDVETFEKQAHWLLFLHADTRLAAGWAQAVCAFMTQPEYQDRFAAFQFKLADSTKPPAPTDFRAASARRLEKIVAWRCRYLGLPYGDQGLLISASLYQKAGGYEDSPLMEDVALIRSLWRLGKKWNLTLFSIPAYTSDAKYRRGYHRRSFRNILCLVLWFCGVSPRRIAKLYS